MAVEYASRFLVTYMHRAEMRSIFVDAVELMYLEDLDEVDILYVMRFNEEYLDALVGTFAWSHVQEGLQTGSETNPVQVSQLDRDVVQSG